MYVHTVPVHTRLIAVLVVTAAAVAGCATARLASGWAPGPVHADGNVDDWSDEQACTTMGQGLHLSVANDAGHLYVVAKFRANDARWSRPTSMGGMTLHVTGPGKRTMSFRLPQGPERSGAREGSGGPPDSAPASGRMPSPSDRLRDEFQGKLVVTDFDKLDVPVPTDGSQGPAAAFSNENGMCVYEFSIPLRDTALGHYSLDAGAGAGLNLAVTAGPSAAQREAMRDMQPEGGPPAGSGGPGGGPGGRGGFGGGSGPGGARRGGPPGGLPGASSPSVKVAVRLAVEP